MELSALLHAGAMAAIVASALNILIVTLATRWRGRPYQSTQQQLLTLLIQLIAGMGLGGIFWLSWGLTALVAVNWWQRGLTFALLLWSIICVPIGLQLLLSQRAQWRATVSVVLQWLTVLVAVGLACAWSWTQHSR